MRRSLAYALAVLALTATPLATGAADGPPPARKAKTGGSETIRSIAEVIAVNMKTREVTLKRDDGNSLTVLAGPAVKNLTQIRVGDFVVAEYGRAKALAMKKTAATNGAVAESKRPAAGGKASTPVYIIVADIIAIDDKKGFATLKETKGNDVVDVVVKDRKLLGTLRIGDLVVLEYSAAIAVSVKPARSRH